MDGAAYGEAQAVLFHHRDLVEGPPDWPPPWGIQMPPAEEQKVLVMDNERQVAEAEALAALGPRPPRPALGVDELQVALLLPGVAGSGR